MTTRDARRFTLDAARAERVTHYWCTLTQPAHVACYMGTTQGQALLVTPLMWAGIEGSVYDAFPSTHSATRAVRA